MGALFVSLHLKQKIEEIVDKFCLVNNMREIKIDIIPGLDIDSEFLYLGQRQLETIESNKKGANKREHSLLMVVADDTFDEYANSKIFKISRMLWEGMGYGWAQVCLVGQCGSTIDRGMDYAIKLNYRHIIVLPYFLFIGNQAESFLSSLNTILRPHQEIELTIASSVNQGNRLIEVFGNRLQGYSGRVSAMNCMKCSHREQIIK